MNKYYSPSEAAARLHISIKTLANWRSDRTAPGPKFLRIGNRILYPKTEFDAWLADSLHASTDTYRYRASAIKKLANMDDAELDLELNDLVSRMLEIQAERSRRQGERGDVRMG